MKLRALHATDFYKTGHREQYEPGTEYVYSNFTCRSDARASVGPGFDHRVVVFGLQGVCTWLLKDLWNETFFSQHKARVLQDYRNRIGQSLGVTNPDVSHVEALHDLGYLPIKVKGVPEGSRVDVRVPIYTVQSTLKPFFWLTNYVETQLSAELWKPLTSATTAYEYRKILEHFAVLTGSSLDFVDFQAHDFSARGLSGNYDAASSGCGHLTSFRGTDTVHALDYLDDYYFGWSSGMPPLTLGGSVFATEHSVMCMGGLNGELATIHRLITDVYPSGIVSIVADTWDFWQVLTVFLPQLKETILARPGKVVVRPDSGDPVKIICGDPAAPPGSPEHAGAVETLWNLFGGTVTEKGYRLLDEHVGLIYGDSITLERAFRILQILAQKGFASANVVFGVGSFTYQLVTRDSYGTAIKATFGVVNGEDRELYKDPKTDDGTKRSLKGLIRVEKEGNRYVAYDQQTREQEAQGILRTTFEDGQLYNLESIYGIRQRLKEEV